LAKQITDIADLTPDAKNANRGTERGRYMIEQSLRKLGAGRSIVVDADGQVVAGNKTLEAAAELDLPVRVVRTNGQELVVVQREDWHLDADGPAREYAYADNRASEIGLDWDPAQVALDLDAGLDLSDMFREDELQAVLEQAANEMLAADGAEAPEPQIDKAAELQEKWQIERGQIWEIPSKTVNGRCHRVMCGDSTSADDVARLYGDARLSVVWTDPPYGVSYGKKNRYLQTIGRADRLLGDIEGDDLKPEQVFVLVRDALAALATLAVPGAVAYVAAPPGPLHRFFIDAMNASGFQYRHQLIWLKNQLVFGRSDYMYKHEPILYGWLQNGAHFFEPRTSNCSVFEFDRPRASKMHPTEKPVELVAAMIQNSCQPGDTVGEAFAGSGTDFVAAERTGRLCYGMEIEPKYVAVTLQRLVDMALEPRLAGTS